MTEHDSIHSNAKCSFIEYNVFNWGEKQKQKVELLSHGFLLGADRSLSHPNSIYSHRLPPDLTA